MTGTQSLMLKIAFFIFIFPAIIAGVDKNIVIALIAGFMIGGLTMYITLKKVQ